MYFPFYAHQLPQPTKPARPKHPLSQEEADLFRERWVQYHSGLSPHQPPVLTLPLKSLNVPIGPVISMPLLPQRHTEFPSLKQVPLKTPKPDWFPSHVWQNLYPAVEDHLRYDKWTDTTEDPLTDWIVSYAAHYHARIWTVQPLTASLVYHNSQRYGHNVYDILRWIVSEAKRTTAPMGDMVTLLSLTSEHYEFLSDLWMSLVIDSEWRMNVTPHTALQLLKETRYEQH